MIIKGLFRRYERWNPVHPTSGAFWGMGLGVGCGVGWGPGFGPEVVGYVGAGCGVGFSVGFTLAGVGIGLPANFLYQVPYNAAVATTNLALDFARSNNVLSPKDASGNVWVDVAPYIWSLQREASEKMSFIKQNHHFVEGIDFFDMRKRLSGLTAPIREGLRSFQGHLISPHKGSED